jgi:hypothetical protein
LEISATTRQWIGIQVMLLLLTTCAAADSMHGYVTQTEDNHFSIRARFFPQVGFDVTAKTKFVCHKERVPFKALHVGDLVEVKFRSTQQKWEAVLVKIRAKKTYCSARSQLR